MSTQPSFRERDFNSVLNDMIEKIRSCHHRFSTVQDSEKEKLFNALILTIQIKDKIESDDIYGMVRQIYPEGSPDKDDAYIASWPLSPTIIALTLGLRALRACNQLQDAELAWSYLADCCYWSGVAISGKGIADVQSAERKELASRGAQAKNHQYAEMKAYAYQLIRERCPENGWPSVKSAALTIEEEFPKYKSSGSLTVKKVDPKTILNWLSQMPDRDKYFQTKKRS